MNTKSLNKALFYLLVGSICILTIGFCSLYDPSTIQVFVIVASADIGIHSIIKGYKEVKKINFN